MISKRILPEGRDVTEDEGRQSVLERRKQCWAVKECGARLGVVDHQPLPLIREADTLPSARAPSPAKPRTERAPTTLKHPARSASIKNKQVGSLVFIAAVISIGCRSFLCVGVSIRTSVLFSLSSRLYARRCSSINKR